MAQVDVPYRSTIALSVALGHYGAYLFSFVVPSRGKRSGTVQLRDICVWNARGINPGYFGIYTPIQYQVFYRIMNIPAI